MRTRTTWSLVVLALLLVAFTPAVASAVVTNDFGNSYVGTEPPGCNCHNTPTPIPASPHSEMVKVIPNVPGALVPAAGSGDWPAPSWTPDGIAAQATDVWLQVGNGFGVLEYVGFAGAFPIAGAPADEAPLFDPLGWDQHTQVWEAGGKVGTAAYFQRCGGCHNTGVTRSANTSQTLANGAEIGPSTPTTVAAFSITCEVCHGTGEISGGGHVPSIFPDAVPNVVGVDSNWQKLFNAQVCGQCHVNGTTPETNFAGGKFSSPNGYTVDETLTPNYLVPASTVPTEGQYLANPNAYRFFPNGSNRNMRHSYYNEWLQNKAENGFGHMNPTNAVVQSFGGACLKCHSGEGFLERIATVSSTYPPVGFSVTTQTASIGISCQVCHTGHVPNTNVRADYARVGSEGPVTCELCHNWQYEVLGQPTTTEDGQKRPPLGQRVRHPQREMFNGNGMWGVDDDAYGVFMTDTKCADCHMPDTYSEFGPNNPEDYLGAPNTRQSHRFKVMEPGKAAAWGVRPGGDSCTPCHPSRTRAQLQTWIDDTVGEVTAVRANVTAYKDAARALLPGAPATDDAALALPASPQADAWKMAYANWDFVGNDASGGAHNPPYAIAGLEVAQTLFGAIDAQLTLTTTNDVVTPNTSVAMSGTLTDLQGAPVADQMVDVQVLNGAAWQTVATAKTNALGNYVASVDVATSGVYRAMWAATDTLTVLSPEVPITVDTGAGAFVPVLRVSGQNRYDVAARLSAINFADGSVANIVVASGENFPDALSASGLAGTVASPILLVQQNAVPSVIANEIERIANVEPGVTTTVWIVGGPNTISGTVSAALNNIPGIDAVQRIGGANRYDVSANVCDLVADIQGPGFVGQAFVANGQKFTDALAVSPVAWSQGFPVLLTAPTALPNEIRSAITANGVSDVVIAGGTASVSPGVASAIDGLTGVNTPVRWAGANRYSTATKIANEAVKAGWASYDYVGVASGQNFPDALSGGPVAGYYGGVLVLTEPTFLPTATFDFFDTNYASIKFVEIYGGPASVSDAVRIQITDLLNF